MRFLVLAAVAALSLSTAVEAATVTYTVSGRFTESSQFGANGATFAAELGTPSTYEASFTFDAAALDTFPTLANQGMFIGFGTTVKIDGQPWFTSNISTLSINNPVANSNYGPESLTFQAVSPQRTGPAGSEYTAFQAILVFSAGAVDPDHLPTAATAFDGMIRNLAAISIGAPNNSSNAIRRTAVNDDHLMTVSITPAPEPGEWAMIAGGLGIVGAAARRRQRG